MPSGENSNSQAALAPHQYKRGAEWTGNRKGGRRFGATLRDWWNALGIEDEDGVPKYTLDEIAAIADAPGDDKSVSQAKRIAARVTISRWQRAAGLAVKCYRFCTIGRRDALL